MKSTTLCVNGEKFLHSYSTQKWPDSLNLLAYLNELEVYPKWYWQGRDQKLEVAAIGSLLEFNSVPLFQKENNSPARFWGGHAFSPDSPSKDPLWATFPRCRFFLPHYEIVRQNGKTELITHFLNGSIPKQPPTIPSFFSGKGASCHFLHHSPPKEEWIQLIQDSLHLIEREMLQKVVLARRSTYTSTEKLHPFALLKEVKSSFATRFAIQFSKEQAFIGATPEILYTRKKNQLKTEALAATCPLGEKKELFESGKEREEFSLVKTSIQESLSLFCERFSVREEKIVKTSHLQHLYASIEASLKDSIPDAEILAFLHPSAALGGLPRKSALEYLLTIEPFERGWYAAPLGYISQDEAEFAVGIRSALVEDHFLHLFAGTGIVKGSTPEKEWEELEQKTSLWNKVLT